MEAIKNIGDNGYAKETKVPKMRSEIIGHILKFLRKEKKLTQKTVAENLGIAQQTYAGYESGKHEPNIETAIRISNFYGLSLDYITGRFADSDDEKTAGEIELDVLLKYSYSHYAAAEELNRKNTELIKKTVLKEQENIKSP